MISLISDWKILKLKFWNYRDVAAGGREQPFNFRRMWRLTVLLTAGVALVPLIAIIIVDYQMTQRSIESENLMRTARLVSNTHRSISFFFTQRKAALDFVAQEYSFETLNEPGMLQNILKNLKISFGGITDIDLFGPQGNQRNYVGPYELLGKNYSDQHWYQEVCKRGAYISDVFLGFRKVPHIVIAIKRTLPNGLFFILRTTLDTSVFEGFLTGLELGGKSDIFMINREGILQTSSLYYGKIFEKSSLFVPGYARRTRVLKKDDPRTGQIIIGYRYIPETPFILMLVQNRRELLKTWYKTRMELILFLTVSVILIVGVVIWMATYLVNKIFQADQARVATLHQVEYSNKMASIGRLAAGVAHEVNNPLAIINEKAGLIKDLITFSKKYEGDEKLHQLVDSILASVQRAGAITKRLLSFSRYPDISLQPIELKQLIEEVLTFFEKEAQYRSILISLDAAEDMPVIKSDRGKLQEIFLNLFNNACLAMEYGGHLDIRIRVKDENSILVTVTDDGCGMPREDLERIFEPFFSTRTDRGGTGLGLSLTANFLRKLGGDISVESDPGKGTTFTVTLPVKTQIKDGKVACEFY